MEAGNHATNEIIRAPGLGAYLRRHPRLGRNAAVAAIGSGVALFALAAATAGAAAPIAAPAPTVSADLPPAAPLPPLAGPTSAASASPVLHRDPKQVAKPAPVTHGVISGLAANGIPQVALNAYRVAATRMASVAPGCGIDWALLAGIGRVESDHGRFAGAVLHADGVSTPRIVGIPLDGSRSEAILDTDGGSLDGDPVYDRALGPMQFIPSTWAIYGTDATGDGKADIFNINDAALSAARYLCAAGGNLRARDGQVRAVLSYNHSSEYLAQVLALADAYRRGIPISGIPVGITSGPLPTITDTGYIPPANPGAPPAGQPGKGDGGTPKPGASPAGGGEPHSSTAKPAPSSSPTKPKPSGTSSTAKPTPTKSTPPPTTSSPTPTPTPTSTCNAVEQLLHQC